MHDPHAQRAAHSSKRLAALSEQPHTQAQSLAATSRARPQPHNSSSSSSSSSGAQALNTSSNSTLRAPGPHRARSSVRATCGPPEQAATRLRSHGGRRARLRLEGRAGDEPDVHVRASSSGCVRCTGRGVVAVRRLRGGQGIDAAAFWDLCRAHAPRRRHAEAPAPVCVVRQRCIVTPHQTCPGAQREARRRPARASCSAGRRHARTHVRAASCSCRAVVFSHWTARGARTAHLCVQDDHGRRTRARRECLSSSGRTRTASGRRSCGHAGAPGGAPGGCTGPASCAALWRPTRAPWSPTSTICSAWTRQHHPLRTPVRPAGAPAAAVSERWPPGRR